MALVGPNGVVERACRGRVDAMGGSPITPDTGFELASATKWLTAVTALRLCDQGVLALDEPLASRLAVFDQPAADARPITLRDLLQHTSGLADYLEHGMYADPDELTRASVEARLPGWVRQARPGQRHAYSNTNFHAVAALVEQVHPEGFAGALQELFNAAAMGSSRLIASPGASGAAGGGRNLGLVEGVFEATDDLPTDVVGDGGVITTLNDAIAFVRAFTGGTLLSERMRGEMTRAGRLDDRSTFDYGLGLELQHRDGRLIGFGHTGSWTNATTCLLVDLRTATAVVVLSNQFMAPVVAIAQAALRQAS